MVAIKTERIRKKIALILAASFLLLCACGVGSEEERQDGSADFEGSAESTEHIDVSETSSEEITAVEAYNALLRSIRSEINQTLVAPAINEDTLWENYEVLLYLYMREYFFKSMAYGQFTGDYDTKRFEYLAENCEALIVEMKEYLDADEVDEIYLYFSLVTYDEFEHFDFSPYLIGREDSPDVDAMWNFAWEEFVKEVRGIAE